MMPHAWRKEAACFGAVTPSYDPFTPDIDKGRKLEPAVREGMKYCAKCPVIQQCAQAALDQGPHVYGLWAGVALTGSHDRDRMRKVQRIAAGDGEIQPIDCHAPGCERTDLRAKGYCGSHYEVYRQGGDVGSHSRVGMKLRRQEWLTLVAELRAHGMNDDQLAAYFKVKPKSFQRRLERYRALDNAKKLQVAS